MKGDEMVDVKTPSLKKGEGEASPRPEEGGGCEMGEEKIFSALSSLVEAAENYKGASKENVDAKDSLQNALIKLGELFKAEGVVLGNTTISASPIPIEAILTFKQDGVDIDFYTEFPDFYAVYTEDVDAWAEEFVGLLERVAEAVKSFTESTCREAKRVRKLAEVIRMFTALMEG